MNKIAALLTVSFAAFLIPLGYSASTLSIGQAEAGKCEQEINTITEQLLSKYTDSLAAMQAAYQKSADLEYALAIRAELNRVKKNQTLTEQSFVAEPRALRDLQVQTYGRMREFWSQILQSHIPKLTELKKNLTMDGHLDDAVAVRDLIGQLQDKYGTSVKMDANTVLPAGTLLQDYAADKDRADKLYKGKKITLSGTVATFQQDASDQTSYNIYLTAKGADVFVQCSFAKEKHSFREDKQGLGNVVLSVSPLKPGRKPENETKIFKGMTLNLQGMCEGMDKMVMLSKCNLLDR